MRTSRTLQSCRTSLLGPPGTVGGRQSVWMIARELLSRVRDRHFPECFARRRNQFPEASIFENCWFSLPSCGHRVTQAPSSRLLEATAATMLVLLLTM
ncbi:hypothetical protein ADK59_34835 [Streptomyces sp. XY332]|nr:hypothetical protein ADK59_34835 [Streptomyces sp. XY332]